MHDIGNISTADITIPMNAIHCIEGCGLAMLCRYVLLLLKIYVPLVETVLLGVL